MRYLRLTILPLIFVASATAVAQNITADETRKIILNGITELQKMDGKIITEGDEIIESDYLTPTSYHETLKVLSSEPFYRGLTVKSLKLKRIGMIGEQVDQYEIEADLVKNNVPFHLESKVTVTFTEREHSWKRYAYEVEIEGRFPGFGGDGKMILKNSRTRKQIKNPRNFDITFFTDTKLPVPFPYSKEITTQILNSW